MGRCYRRSQQSYRSESYTNVRFFALSQIESGRKNGNKNVARNIFEQCYL